MRFVGAHVSIGGGVENAVDRALAIGANALGIFTRNQRRWDAPPLTLANLEAFRSRLAACGIEPRHVVPHSSYLINLASPDESVRCRSLSALTDETRRAEALGLTMVNLHPGSHLGKLSEDEGLRRIAQGINCVHAKTFGVALVLENTAGSGHNLGRRFDQLRKIIEMVEDTERVGVCLDTCHLYAAGYDIRSESGWRRTMGQFEREVGLVYLRAMHLNDSKVPLGSRTDRHESLGRGRLGYSTFRTIMEDGRLRHLPFILETTRPSRWSAEIRLLRAFADPVRCSGEDDRPRHRAWEETRRMIRSQ